jgi:hypothetical protein
MIGRKLWILGSTRARFWRRHGEVVQLKFEWLEAGCGFSGP